MKESVLQARVLSWIRDNLKKPFVCWKLSDSFTRGIPDCFCLFRNGNGELVNLFIEFKTERSPGVATKQTEIQKHVFELLNEIGNHSDLGNSDSGRVVTAIVFDNDSFNDLKFWLSCQGVVKEQSEHPLHKRNKKT